MRVPSTSVGAGPAAARRAWVWMLALAVLLIALGLFAMSASAFSATAFVLVLGWLLIIAGLAQIGGAFLFRGMGGFGAEIFFGALGALLGLVMIMSPVVAGSLIALLLVGGLILDALLEGARAALTRYPGWIWPLLIALLAAGLGIAIILNPALLLPLLGFLVGVNLAVRGVTLLLAALAVRKLGAAR